MHKLKSIKLYFFSILKLFFLSFRNYYYKSRFYNKKLATFIPDRIFYNPSTYLTASLTSLSNDFYKINNEAPKSLWEVHEYDKLKSAHGVGMAPVSRGSCGNCFSSLPPQFLVEVRSGDILQTCTGCGVFLFWEKEESE